MEIGRNINKAFERGYDTYFDLSAADILIHNPYTRHSPSWKAWRAGFRKARLERNEITQSQPTA